MGAPRSAFHPGLTDTGRLHAAGLPVSVSPPALLIVVFGATFATVLALLVGWSGPQYYVLSCLPLLVLVWAIERIDPAIFWLLASWVRHVLLAILASVGSLRRLGAASRDPWGV